MTDPGQYPPGPPPWPRPPDGPPPGGPPPLPPGRQAYVPHQPGRYDAPPQARPAGPPPYGPPLSYEPPSYGPPQSYGPPGYGPPTRVVPRQPGPARPAPAQPPSRSRHSLAQARAKHRRRRLIVVGSLLVALGLVATDLYQGWHGGFSLLGFHGHGASHAAGAPTSTPTGSASTSVSASAPAAVAVPQTGPGTFAFAGGPGTVLGTAGNLRRFRVAVENGIGQDPAAFAATADQILGDPRSWIAGGDIRFQRVAQPSQFEFTLYLASPGTTDKLCSIGGVHTEQFASCRLPGQVIINLARWLTAVPGYGAPLATYQQYALNHEVGRELGHGNEACPAPGARAPVMQQQSQGLKGCVANAWPYVNGQLYQGGALP